jgi:PD-(D/E)XK nuclease superfamily
MELRPSKKLREEYSVDYSGDTDFSAYARYLQSKWRVSKGLPFNKKKYGNFLPPEIAEKEKANFLTDKTKLLAEYELLRKRNFGKLIKEDRMWENLLSSQPLAFNLFGELHFDHKLATGLFKRLFPGKLDKVTEILFEHSPGRGDKNFTGDRSAFDVFVEYSRKGAKGFIGIEIKYAENLREETGDKAAASYKKHKINYTDLTTPKIFKSNAIDTISKIPLSQIWRDHLLSLATRKIYDEGFFVFLFPKQNKECQAGVDAYQKFLVGNNSNEELTGFFPRYLDDFILTLKEMHHVKWTEELDKRYLG